MCMQIMHLKIQETELNTKTNTKHVIHLTIIISEYIIAQLQQHMHTTIITAEQQKVYLDKLTLCVLLLRNNLKTINIRTE